MKNSQHAGELEDFLEVIASKQCGSFLEIGSRYGETLNAVARVLPEGATIVSVELPAGAWGRHDSERVLFNTITTLCSRGFDATVIFGDSTEQSVIDKVAALGPFDAILIDGDHRYDGVKADWDNYRPMASKLVAFHDIIADEKPNGQGFVMGVPKLWREVKKNHGVGTLVEEYTQSNLMGIGVIHVD